MFIYDILLAFILALIFAGILTAAMGRRGPGPFAGAVFFFVLIFLIVWAGGLWVPLAPGFVGAGWFAFLIFGLIAALLIAALTPVQERNRREGDIRLQETGEPPAEAPSRPEIVVGGFFWVFVIVLMFLIIGAYV